MVPNFTHLNGNGRYPRAIRELQGAVLRGSAVSAPGALVSVTPRGTIIQPDGTVLSTTQRPNVPAQIPRWG